MTREFKKGDPDLFDLAWLDHEELQKFQEAMLSYSANDICRYWLHCLNEQAAIRSGKLRVIPGADGRDPDFKQYALSDIHAAQLILGALESQFQATGKPNCPGPLYKASSVLQRRASRAPAKVVISGRFIRCHREQ
jgi:hypothetical protein